ncbi:hypothetical protein C1646_762901 [Rhizophagus diaphanus]|nr:hypothetical protein C1646_762901 [Rhizophagus diaphanus] [Rhizophagus sp. MUCL 43196]
MDAYYCAVLFRYLREFSIKYRQYVCFISADDKHKVSIGEGIPVSTGVCNYQSLAAQNNGFYNGEVFVSFKDTVFEPNSAIQYITEFYNVINTKYTHYTSPPILCLYTNGRPNHICTYSSIQIALISLFLSEDYDMLIAMQTAPHHSWTNLVERIMSILNLRLQNVAIKRNTMDEESDEIREILKDQPFKCYDATSEQDINCLFEFMSKIESSLTCNDTTQVQLIRHKELINFIKTYCYEHKKMLRPVMWHIMKFNQMGVFLHFLPDPIPAKDHYSSFHTVYGMETSEEFRLTLQINQVNAESALKGVLIRGKICDYVTCYDCGKRHCIFSDKALSQEEMQDFKQALDAYDYSYGAPLFSDDHYLIEVLFICVKISCDTPIEILYYSSQKSGNSDICYYCGTDSDFVDPPDSIRTKYKIIYLLCQRCQDKGKEFSTYLEVKVNNNKRRKTS